MMELIDKKINKIHNYIYANEGLGNEEVLNEFLKIFYCKILDEQEGNIFSRANTVGEVLERVEILYDNYKSKLKGIVDSKEKINLKKDTIIYVITELRDVRFNSISSDIKGHILQKIIDRSYRENRGQFFTPTNVVDFMVKMLNPQKGEIGCDPASGTGGFMFRALEYVSHNSDITQEDISNVYFYDISKPLIKLIAMRMMFEFSFNKPNFTVKDSISDEFNLCFDYILTNPPFGTQGKISNSNILKKYKLGTDSKGKPLKGQAPDILFVEKVVSLLKNGGKGAIILPEGNFENPTQEYFRRYLIENTRIDAIVSLPDGTFIPYGTGVKSSIVFFTKIEGDKLKKELERDYKVFFGKITRLGYTFSKHSKDMFLSNGQLDEDYSNILSAYLNKEYNDNAYTIPISEVINNRYILSESFHSPVYKRIIEKLQEGECKPLYELVEFNYKKAKIDKELEYNYIEIADINAYTSEIINSTSLMGDELPSRASYMLEEDDIIVATSGNSIGTKKQSKALVGRNFNGSICTNGFTVMKVKNISKYYLLMFFNSDDFLKQVLRYKYGTAIPCIGRENFENILVPILSDSEMMLIDKKVKKAFKLRNEAFKLMQS